MIIDVITEDNRVNRCVALSICFLVIAGCSISAPQAASSYRFAKDLISSDSSRLREQEAKWLASVDGRGAVLRPYNTGGLIVFANTEGDAIAFDGWTIRSIIGFGLAGPLSISGKDGNRTFSTADRLTSTECDPWRSNGSGWRQICANGEGQIVLNQNGNIELIVMSLGEDLGIVTLRVAQQLPHGGS